MAGKAWVRGTSANAIGSMEYESRSNNTLSTGDNIWQVFQPDSLTQQENTPANTFLNVEGDNMTGIFGISSWSTSSGSLYQLTASTEILDLARDKMHSSRWVWVASGSTTDKLSKITNAEFDGQLLFIENIQGETPTIYDESSSSVSGANIKTLSGSNYIFSSDKQIVLLMYSVIDSQWHMITGNTQTWTSETGAFDGGLTGGIRVGLTGQTNASRVIINSWAHFSGYFNVKDSGGTDRKVPYI